MDKYKDKIITKWLIKCKIAAIYIKTSIIINMKQRKIFVSHATVVIIFKEYGKERRYN